MSNIFCPKFLPDVFRRDPLLVFRENAAVVYSELNLILAGPLLLLLLDCVADKYEICG